MSPPQEHAAPLSPSGGCGKPPFQGLPMNPHNIGSRLARATDDHVSLGLARLEDAQASQSWGRSTVLPQMAKMAKIKIPVTVGCTLWITVFATMLCLAVKLLAAKAIVGTRAPCYNASAIVLQCNSCI